VLEDSLPRNPALSTRGTGKHASRQFQKPLPYHLNSFLLGLAGEESRPYFPPVLRQQPLIARCLPAALTCVAAGLLACVWATCVPNGWIPLRVPLRGGHDARCPMAITGNRLIVRNLTRMVCLDLRKK